MSIIGWLLLLSKMIILVMRRSRLGLKVRKRKLRKTYTLSVEAIAILEEERKERQAKSISSTLEEILTEQRGQRHMKRMAASISKYYDSLSDNEVNEERLWGAFAESQFPRA